MKSATRVKRLSPAMGRLVLALVMAGAVAGALAAPARADDHDRYDRERYDRDRAPREWREHHRHPVHVVRPPPAYVYAPPPVVYAPPPPPSGINLIFPLTIR